MFIKNTRDYEGKIEEEVEMFFHFCLELFFEFVLSFSEFDKTIGY